MGYDMISPEPNKNISSINVSTTRDISQELGVYYDATSFNRRPVSRAATVMLPIELLA